MADTQPKRKPTWQEKLAQGKPLNAMDDVKAEADFNYKMRLRQEEERKAFEAMKAQGRISADESIGTDGADEGNDDSNSGKKGK